MPYKIWNGMNIRKANERKHTDESERFKRKSLNSQKNRKKMAKILQWILYIIAFLIIVACFYTYFAGTV